MKRIFFATIGLIIFMSAASAQQDVWQELENQVAEPLKRKDYAAAEQKAKEVLATAEKTFGAESTYVGKALYILGAIYHAQGKKEAALEVMKRAQKISNSNIQKHQMTFNMAWRYGNIAPEWPKAQHIILTFVDYSNHYFGIYSNDEFRQYLESLPKGPVPVVLEVSYDTSLKKVVSHNILQIGELKKWQSFNSYTGNSGDYSPAPYEEVRKLIK